MSNRFQCENTSVGGKAGEYVFMLLGLSLLAGLPIWTAYRLYMAKSTEDWPTTHGTVIDASFKERLRGAPDEPSYTEFIPFVSYEYTIDGTTYTSNRVAYNNLTTVDQRELTQFLGSYPGGSTVDVFYSPRNPSCSVLLSGIPGSDEYFREVMGFVGLIVFFVVVLGAIWVLGQIPSAGYGIDSAADQEDGANDARGVHGIRSQTCREVERLHRSADGSASATRD